MLEEFQVVDWGRIVRDPPSLVDDFDWQANEGDDYTGEEGDGEAW